MANATVRGIFIQFLVSAIGHGELMAKMAITFFHHIVRQQAATVDVNATLRAQHGRKVSALCPGLRTYWITARYIRLGLARAARMPKGSAPPTVAAVALAPPARTLIEVQAFNQWFYV